ncbi:NB-ARC domain-containing protein [Streptomyces griseorubiginosus]|uniref:NB-ARC domain-containing protein n=1 Tax=Streptomyces griseorubiginosus TaxID=67304 RepID=UPI001AD72DA3|nr:NB-ARC domain-containing protein [Streptomyces griseorubiginosus]MBO4260677.1 NACHT domain-containing protein [Streptomyces griseorubiginosus]
MLGKKDAPGPGNLPPDSRPFVGRQDELAWLAEELMSGGRLLTLVGVGGVGKTRLAMRAAEAARDVHPDGVWLVELSAFRACGQVPLAVMETLRLVDRSNGSAIEALSLWARDKRLLLVLDSCEHLLTDCVTLVADLLAVAPGLRVLATSRERLGMPGERVLAVDPGVAQRFDAGSSLAHPSAATASISTSTPSRTGRATTVVRAGSGVQSAKNSR